MRINTSFLIIVCFILFFSTEVSGQKIYKLKGIVQDSLRIGIPNADISLIIGKDTSKVNTDTAGNFVAAVPKVKVVSLLVKHAGYFPYAKECMVRVSGSEMILEPVVLQPQINQLKEVIIKAKIVAVRLMKDTVEFNAAAYIVREGDRVADLLKQLPGIEVDRDGNVKSAGKMLTKIRVNGKDFFTGNVKEFISQLPAHIVSRIQVIDDYGDNASFTGIRNGEPQKMLNLVIKEGEDNGDFGGVSGSLGTNDRHELSLRGNFWRGTKQIGVNGGASSSSNTGGVSKTSNAGINYRNTLGKNVVLNWGYNYGDNHNSLSRQDYIETASSIGSIQTLADNETVSKSKSNNLNIGIQSAGKSGYMQGNIRGILGSSSGNVVSTSNQTGVIRQDLLTHSLSNQKNPNLNADFTLGRRFAKPGRIISFNVALGSSLTNGNEALSNEIGYYEGSGGHVVKDSVLNRQMNTRNLSKNLNANFTFTEPLGHSRNADIKRNLDFTYSYALTTTNNQLVTDAGDGKGALQRIDSLSNKYVSSFATQRAGLNYRYSDKKINYNIGIAFQPSVLNGEYEGLANKIRSENTNLFPVMRFDYNPSTKNSFSIYYNGNSVAPNFNQLQPVPDLRNLQNVVIGNPSLKAAFNHSVSLSYRHTNPDDNSSLQVLLNGTAVQNQVVVNTILQQDTLNTLKQETRFQNTNGNYKAGGNYYWSLPLLEKKLNFELKGGFSYDRQVSFNQSIKNFGKGLGFNQGTAIRMNQKWLMFNIGADYSYKKNTYSLDVLNSNVVQSWLFSADYRVFILKNLSLGVSGTKTINEGFALPGNNPLVINSYIEKSFFKNRILNLRFDVNDLLNQANTISRSVNDNSISESRTNQVTRYFLLGLSLNLQRFAK